MAYVNVAEWKPEQVTEWLKGLDNAVLSYVHSFLNNEVSGQQLLNLRPDDLDHLGVHKLGHQELILEAVEHLRNFHYELDRENLQLLALRLSCRAHSLHNELCQQTDSRPVSTQTLADVANVITAVKPLVCWLDRSPFTGQLDYQDRKSELLRLSLAIATCAQRDRFAERPVEEIRTSCKELARLADSIIQDIVDPLILQPASLDLATLKKRAGDDLGFFILPSFHGAHQIGEIKFSSPAHQCGKIEEGDEVVQVNYQTVVGWQTKRVMALFEESPTDVFLTLKKRPRHTKVYGQIYMKPYRLPSKKRAAPYTRWHDNLPSPRPELLTIPDFEMPLPRAVPKQMTPQPSVLECEPLASNSSSDDDDDDSFLPCVQDEGQTSPTSMRLYLPKPRVTVQRRATVTGASPTNKRPPVNIEQFWRELRLERQWKDSGPAAGGDDLEGRKDELYQLRDKSASFGNDLSVSPPPRPTTCLGIENSCNRMKSGKKQEKKLRIIESRNNTHIVEDCDELPNDSMESVKENTPFERQTVRREEEYSGREIQSNRKLSNENQDICLNEVRDNGTVQGNSNITTKEDNQKQGTDGVEATNKPSLSHQEDDDKVHAQRFSREGSCTTQNKDEESYVRRESESSMDSDRTRPPSDTQNCHDKTHDAGNILRVKGGGYGLPSDDLTDVFQPVGKVSDVHVRKSTTTSTESSVFVHKERGRLDKSYSTPAYDLTDSDQRLDRSSKTSFIEEWSSCHASESSSALPSPGSESSAHSVFQLDNQTQGALDNESGSSSSKTVDLTNSECSDVTTQDGDLYSLEDKQTQRIGEILETINIALLQHRLKEHGHVSRKILHKAPVDHADAHPHEMADSTYHESSGSDKPDMSLKADTSLSHNQKAAPYTSVLQNKETDLIETSLTVSYRQPEIPSSAQICTTKDLVPLQREVWQKAPKQLYLEEKQQRYLDEPPTQASQVVPPDSPQVRICVTPPEPPPRPALPPDHPRGAGSVGYRAIMAARSLGRNTGSKSSLGGHATFPSPRSLRKRNPLLAKKRNVSVRDLGVGDYEGWLLHRCRSGGAGAVWLRAWFVLKGTVFYGFKTPQSAKADIMISLPGFTASLADEVKSRKYAFKVYHTGTVFYFAVETEDELSVWMESITLATFKQDFKLGQDSDAVYFTETDEESETDMEAETCFPSPKMRKFAGLLSSNSSQQHDKQSCRSQQNLATEPKSQDSQKKFGSLRKLGRKTDEQNTSSSNQEMTGTLTTASSLDRKYLRFLGGSRNNIVPVPTAQFRSYRRVPNGPAPSHQTMVAHHNKAISEAKGQKHERAAQLRKRSDGSEDRSDQLVSARDPSFNSSNEACNVVLQQHLSNSPHNGLMYQSAESVSTLNSSLENEIHDMRTLLGGSVSERGPTMAQGPSTNVRGERMFKQQDRALPHQRHLKVDFRDRQIHSSNPSLQLPSDMADYRLAAERLREFGIRRNRQREDTSGFVTLEEFMLSRQEEERRQNISAAQRPQPTGNNDVYTGYTDDPLSMTETGGSSRNNSWSSNKARNGGPAQGPTVTRRGSFNNSRVRRNNSSDLSQGGREYRGGSPEKIWINSLRRNDEAPKKLTQGPHKNSTADQNAPWNTNRLKTAAQYQPPPVSQNMSGSRNTNQNDEAPRMKLAFEMHLGNNRSPTGSDKDKDSPPSKSSKFRNLFSSSKSQNQKQTFLDLPATQSTQASQQKTILGSPRLHRAIFRDKRQHGPKSSSASDSSNSSISSPTSANLCDWTTEDYGSQCDPGMAQYKPTMGISMIGKKPSRRILSSSPSPASPPPDYPGLEYPPVFEPETYTLSDASSLLRSRQQSHDRSNGNTKPQSLNTSRT